VCDDLSFDLSLMIEIITDAIVDWRCTDVRVAKQYIVD
jgi:hypothetical protein